MFQFPGLPPRRLYIHRRVTWVLHAGFPHSDIPGSLPAGDSPKLFAANHVLHRPIVPRHPPCALRSFNTHAISQLRDFPRLPVQLLRCQHRKRFRFRPPRSMPRDIQRARRPRTSPAVPRPYIQATCFAVEPRGFEPLTPCLQSRCSPAELRPRTQTNA